MGRVMEASFEPVHAIIRYGGGNMSGAFQPEIVADKLQYRDHDNRNQGNPVVTISGMVAKLVNSVL